MPIEIRHIVFSPKEIARAASMLLSKTERLPQVHRIVGVKAKSAPVMYLEVTSEDPEGSRTVRIEESDVIAALLLYCRDKGVPVSRKAAKLVGAVNGAVVLTLCIDVESTQQEKYHLVFGQCYRMLIEKVRTES